MSLQTFINQAQSIEFNRADLVATSISRSGRVITQTRNSVKPWNFKVTPPEVLPWTSYRGSIESIFTKDRHTEHEIQLGSTPGSAWLVAYQGNQSTTGGALDGVSISSIAGNQFTLNVSAVPTGTVIFRAGDIIQPGEGYRYPYAVNDTWIKQDGVNSIVVTVNRGIIAQSGYTFANKYLKVGAACTWRVVVTSMPSILYIPGKLVQFNGMIELLEVVV